MKSRFNPINFPEKQPGYHTKKLIGLIIAGIFWGIYFLAFIWILAAIGWIFGLN